MAHVRIQPRPKHDHPSTATLIAPLLDPKNDLVFKKLFAGAPELLADLINDVRSDEPPIEVVEITNPRIDPSELTGKCIVLDLLVKDQYGRYYDIEMQVRRYAPWSARSTYYLARVLSNQMLSGQDYQALKPVIGIHLLDFDLFDGPDQTHQAHWRFEMRDQKSPQIKLGDELQLHIIELPKADRLGLTSGQLANWVALFEHWKDEAAMQTIDYPPVKQALNRLKTLSADEETRRLAMVRERALFEEAIAMSGAKAQGIEIGKAEGKVEGKAELFITLLTKRFGPLTLEVTQRLQTATPEQLERWAARILEAPTLADFFSDH